MYYNIDGIKFINCLPVIWLSAAERCQIHDNHKNSISIIIEERKVIFIRQKHHAVS